MVRDIVVGELLTVAVAAIAMALTAVVAWRINRVNVVDVTWGLALTAVAGTSAARDGWPSQVLFIVVALWGLRLSWHMARRSRGHGEDPRYTELLGGNLRDVGLGIAVRKVFFVQGAAICLVALPLQAGPVVGFGSLTAFWAGIAVSLGGMLFEAVGDAQLAEHKRNPGRGSIMDRGLWAWTRHPNYFGDAVFWVGIWIAGGFAAGTNWLPAVLTIASPLAMAWFLAFVTGARLLERTMMQRPGYPEYAARTSMFIPLPPRK
jgi:steroid 5-alpha reductase family enzyme